VVERGELAVEARVVQVEADRGAGGAHGEKGKARQRQHAAELQMAFGHADGDQATAKM
jgi:hypothetical protein